MMWKSLYNVFSYDAADQSQPLVTLQGCADIWPLGCVRYERESWGVDGRISWGNWNGKLTKQQTVICARLSFRYASSDQWLRSANMITKEWQEFQAHLSEGTFQSGGNSCACSKMFTVGSFYCTEVVIELFLMMFVWNNNSDSNDKEHF